MSPEELAKYGPIKYNGRKPDHMYEIQKKNKREADDMATRMEQVKAVLSKEKYLELKAEGKNDIQIMDLHQIKYWPDIITRLKEEWGLKGIKSKDMPDPVIEAVSPVEIIDRQEITALAAADEFYTLQEDCEMLDEEISRLTKERVHITDRMQLLKEALEKVVVVI